jgi:hypothetical protein
MDKNLTPFPQRMKKKHRRNNFKNQIKNMSGFITKFRPKSPYNALRFLILLHWYPFPRLSSLS